MEELGMSFPKPTVDPISGANIMRPWRRRKRPIDNNT
jgi:hypothetical protein